MMLDHSSAVPAVRAKVKDDGPYDWAYMTQRLADEVPFWEPGTRNGYHGFTFGWTVGEVVRRASGKSLGTFFREEIAGPLGLDFWIGLPEEIEYTAASVILRHGQHKVSEARCHIYDLFNRQSVSSWQDVKSRMRRCS